MSDFLKGKRNYFLPFGIFLMAVACDFLIDAGEADLGVPGLSLIDPLTGEGLSVDYEVTLKLGEEEPDWKDFVQVGFNTELGNITRVEVDSSGLLNDGDLLGLSILDLNVDLTNEAGEYEVIYTGSIVDPLLTAPQGETEFVERLTVIVEPLLGGLLP